MLFVKRGTRVEAEAAALSAVAGHGGVVELVEAGDGVLRTVLLRDAHPLAVVGALAAEEVAGVVASIAVTLADLHDVGVVHGGIDGGHVLLAADGRPVLCSLGRGGEPADDVLALGTLAGSLLPAAATRPPDRPPPRPPGLLGGRRSSSPDRSQGRRLVRRRRPRLGPMLAPDAARAVSAVLAEATVADPAARPTARALAAAIHQRVPTARLPEPLGRTKLPLTAPRPAARHRRDRRRGALPPPVVLAGAAGVGTGVAGFGEAGVGAAGFGNPGAGDAGLGVGCGVAGPAGARVGVAGLCVGGSGTQGRIGVGDDMNHRRDSSRTTAVLAVGIAAIAAVAVLPGMLRGRRPPVEPSASPAGAATTRPPAPPATPTSAPPVAVRVWPPQPLDFRDGVLTVDHARYALGRPGDAVVAGDWACAGRETLVLLRPGTGEVFAFDEWPAEEGAATARPLAKVAGATEVRVIDGDGDGCDDIEVLRPGADPVRLEPAP